ncbi:phytanoyl-CoA dioxygenase family protein [Pseudoalteromonas piscicida]|uniref:Phytanoyl-CoA dioxygenase n=1 Tax=Pseudoalteromonas piscicida TaxID=43662 RepID=A0A2A5JRV7_PSEO7|nr:phytanoyl-CoA dioxygenase family protein [Pseudoalteromonas piscicida]PCK32155.1 phytanoyl-CoA dioxygenase [Pseudoalteromonas piscicida]
MCQANLAQSLYSLSTLKKIWTEANRACTSGNKLQVEPVDFKLYKTIFDTLGLSQLQAYQLQFQYAHDYDSFIDAIVTIAQPSSDKIALLRHLTDHFPCPESYQEKVNRVRNMPDVLTAEDLQCWRDNGYVIVRNAVSETGCTNAINAIQDYLEIALAEPHTWYNVSPEKINNSMVHLVQHSALEANRNSLRIHKAFSQLWYSERLMVSADQCGFNPPETETFSFQGPDLHWDLDFSKQLSFGTQGILYLLDTEADQGATTIVPGFHAKLDSWLTTAPWDPHAPDPNYLHQLGSKPIAGKAGDLLIWHHFLPHGGSPNRAGLPRIVQYINMNPIPQV